jgi:phage terminase large subunit-like protein
MTVSAVSDLEYAARQFESQTMRLGRPPLEPHQRPPEELLKREKNVWLLEGGRGSGKTEAMARYFSRHMRDNPGIRGRILAPTLGDAVESCITGVSGLLAVDDQVIWRAGGAGGSHVRWPNGSEALVLGTHSPADVDRLRAGGNRHIDWWEELAANRQLGTPDEDGNLDEKSAWVQASHGLRLGLFPHTIASTTPKTTKAYVVIRALPEVVRVHATMWDNPYSSPDWRNRMKDRYQGTRTGRQEIDGILLEDIEGALWTLEMISAVQYRDSIPELLPTMSRIITVVDPSGSEDGDATGIITIGRNAKQVLFVLADDTTKGTPEERYEIACLAAARWGADAFLYERNYGADNISMNLRSTWDRLLREEVVARKMPRLEDIWAKGSKAQRAEGVVGLYEQHVKGMERIWHVGQLAALEDEQTTWEPDADWSPNRVDALVHGARKLGTRIGRGNKTGQGKRAAETLARSNIASGGRGRSPLPPLRSRG